jgi:hypothetical protein
VAARHEQVRPDRERRPDRPDAAAVDLDLPDRVTERAGELLGIERTRDDECEDDADRQPAVRLSITPAGATPAGAAVPEDRSNHLRARATVATFTR